jgi:hypothetical protein
MNRPTPPGDQRSSGFWKGMHTMPLTTFQVSQLKKLQSGEIPLKVFCDDIESEKLCWSGLVGIRADALNSTVTLTDRGRAALAGIN